MPRQLRIEYAGAMYHLMSCGNRRENIFYDEVNRKEFFKTLAKACQKAHFQVHAYRLMSDHFHLVYAGKRRGRSERWPSGYTWAVGGVLPPGCRLGKRPMKPTKTLGEFHHRVEQRREHD